MSIQLMLIWIAGVSAVIVGIGYCAALWMRKRAQADVLREVRQQFSGSPILALASDACFNGLDRTWDSRWRGCGVLILTQELLYFRSWQRNLDLTIPISRMEKVGADSSHEKTGKHRGQFQVGYRGMDDQIRMATWLMKRPQRWENLVYAIIEQKGGVQDEKAQKEYLSQDENARGSSEVVG